MVTYTRIRERTYRLSIGLGLAALGLSGSVAHAGIEVLVNGDIKFAVGPGDDCVQSDAGSIESFSLQISSKQVAGSTVTRAFSTPCVAANQPCYFGDMNSPAISGDLVTWTKDVSGTRVFNPGTGYHYGYEFVVPTVTPGTGPAPAKTPTPDITHSVTGVYALDATASKSSCTALVTLTISPGHTLLSSRDWPSSRVLAAPDYQQPTAGAGDLITGPDRPEAVDPFGRPSAFDDTTRTSREARSFYVVRRVTDQDLELEDLSSANPEFDGWTNTELTRVVEGRYFPNDQPPHIVTVPMDTPYHRVGMNWQQWRWEVLEVLVDAPDLDSSSYAVNEQWSSRVFIATESEGGSNRLPLYLALIVVVAIGVLMRGLSKRESDTDRAARIAKTHLT